MNSFEHDILEKQITDHAEATEADTRNLKALVRMPLCALCREGIRSAAHIPSSSLFRHQYQPERARRIVDVICRHQGIEDESVQKGECACGCRDFQWCPECEEAVEVNQ